jgi:hypothetical protein
MRDTRNYGNSSISFSPRVARLVPSRQADGTTHDRNRSTAGAGWPNSPATIAWDREYQARCDAFDAREAAGLT